MTAQIEWQAYPGPEYYVPTEVPVAFEALLHATDEPEASAAYNDMLFAIGNNHRGTLYPAAVAAVPEIIKLTRATRPWTRWAAVQILIDCWVSFVSEPGFEVVTLADGRIVNVEQTMRAQISSAAPDLRRSLEDESDAVVRAAIAQLVAALDEGD